MRQIILIVYLHGGTITEINNNKVIIGKHYKLANTINQDAHPSPLQRTGC